MTSKKKNWKPRRRISIIWGYYLLVDSMNYTLYKNGRHEPLGYFNSVEDAIGHIIRLEDTNLPHSDLTSYVEQLKKLRKRIISDITHNVVGKNTHS